MSDNSFIISRKDLAPIFDNPRVLQQFEEIQRAVADHVDTIGANVAATEGLAAASYVTLSPNTDLTNEFVLQVGEGLSLDAEAGVLRLTLQAPIVVGGFSVHMTAQGDSTVVLPLTGVLATREWVNSLGFSTGGAATWGAITGTLSAQSDLSAALAGKQAAGSYLVASDLAPYAPLASPTFTGTVGGITKAMVGLGSVDNTADAAKAVLSATKLATARNINGVAFDGTADITSGEYILTRNTTSVNSTAVSTEQDLMTYSLPAGTLATNGQILKITMGGRFAAVARARTVKFYFGTAVITTIGPSSNAAMLNWFATVWVLRTGAATQISLNGYQFTEIAAGAFAPTRPTQTLSGAITIKATGTAAATAVAADIIQDYMIIEICP